MIHICPIAHELALRRASGKRPPPGGDPHAANKARKYGLTNLKSAPAQALSPSNLLALAAFVSLEVRMHHCNARKAHCWPEPYGIGLR